jgi:micrococcal nuclease
MIANGFAFEYTYNKPYLYVDTFRAAQTEARTNQRGLWSPTTCNGQVTP